jgi:hypothetical protein
VGGRRGPNLFEATPGKERGANETRVTSVPPIGTHRWSKGHRQSRVSNLEPVLGGHVRCKSKSRGGRTIVVDDFPGPENAGVGLWGAGTDPTAEENQSSLLDRDENARRARREQAVRMDDRSSGHVFRSGSRCPEALPSRSHLDSPGARSVEVLLRSAARASDGGSAGRTSLLRWRMPSEPGSIRARERARSNQSEAARRDAGLHPTSQRIGSRTGHQPGARL